MFDGAVELDLEEDPNPDEELCVRKEGGGIEIVRSAGDSGNVQRDEERRLLLFNFGFGANWSCLILEH